MKIRSRGWILVQYVDDELSTVGASAVSPVLGELLPQLALAAIGVRGRDGNVSAVLIE